MCDTLSYIHLDYLSFKKGGLGGFPTTFKIRMRNFARPDATYRQVGIKCNTKNGTFVAYVANHIVFVIFYSVNVSFLVFIEKKRAIPKLLCYFKKK